MKVSSVFAEAVAAVLDRFAAALTDDQSNPSNLMFVSGADDDSRATFLQVLSAFCSDDPSVQIPDRISRDVRIVAGRVRWLEPLDLELAPRTTHLFDSVLVRLEALFTRRHMSRRRRGSDTTCNDYNFDTPLEAPGCDDLLANLSRLKRDVVLGYDGNVQQRASEMDPETWAGEVHRAEFARLNVTGRFGRVVSQAAEALDRRRPPLLVLVIDNIDLSPDRTMSVVRLLKQIQVPGIFYLVFGDLDHLEYVIRANTAKEWGGAGMAELIAAIPEEGPRMAEAARRQARQLLDRFVPASQRLSLDPTATPTRPSPPTSERPASESIRSTRAAGPTRSTRASISDFPTECLNSRRRRGSCGSD